MRWLGCMLGVVGCTPADPGPDDGTVDVPTFTDGITGDDGTRVQLHRDIATVVEVTWDQPVAGDSWLSWHIDGATSTSPRVARTAGSQSEVVLGVPAETEVAATLHRVEAGEEVQTALPVIRTGPLPANLVIPTLETLDATRVRPEPWLVASVDVGDDWFFGPWYTVILDLQGRVVWYRETSERRMSWQVQEAAHGGHLVIDESNVYHGMQGTLTRTTLDLRQRDTIVLPDFAQAWDELDDGSFLYNAGSRKDFDISRLHPDGTVEQVWACRPWMAQWRDEYWDCAANTVRYHASRGTVLYSMFETDTVVEIDLASGELQSEFGAYPGGYAFDPIEATFDHQHLPTFTDAGTLLAQTDSPHQQGQWVREFRVDVDNGVLEAIWSLETDHFAHYAGQALPLPSGHILWQHGTAGMIEELTRDGDVVWAVDWDRHLTGNITPVADLYALNSGW